MAIGTHWICALSNLADHGTLEFSVGGGDWPLKGFVIREGAQVFAYLNRCPHAGHPLNWQPNRFLNCDETHLLCASHGALFEIQKGQCVAGPCVGKSLTALPIHIENDQVFLTEDPRALAT